MYKYYPLDWVTPAGYHIYFNIARKIYPRSLAHQLAVLASNLVFVFVRHPVPLNGTGQRRSA